MTTYHNLELSFCSPKCIFPTQPLNTGDPRPLKTSDSVVTRISRVLRWWGHKASPSTANDYGALIEFIQLVSLLRALLASLL